MRGLVLLLVLMVTLVGCGTSTIDRDKPAIIPNKKFTAISSTVGKEAVESASKIIDDTKDDVEDKAEGSSTLGNLTENLKGNIPMLELTDFLRVRECDNEWQMPIHYKSLCDNSPVFEGMSIPDGVSLTLLSIADESYVVGFRDDVGYFALPGDYYVGREVCYEMLQETYENLTEVSPNVYIASWTSSLHDEYIVEFDLDSTGLIKTVFVSVVPESLIEEDGASYIPYKYMAITN